MIPIEPDNSAHNPDDEPWRIRRLVRADGRVRELLRILTPESNEAEGSLGERIWTAHVARLHDDRGTLQAHVSAALGASGWLAPMALAVARAWDGEDEGEVTV